MCNLSAINALDCIEDFKMPKGVQSLNIINDKVYINHEYQGKLISREMICRNGQSYVEMKYIRSSDSIYLNGQMVYLRIKI